MANLINSTEEVWKDISGYEGYYQVSNLGRIKSLERFCINAPNNVSGFIKNEKVLVLNPRNDGYPATTFKSSGKFKTFRVHRLVASAFIPNPHGKKNVNHINGIKTDNRVENLEWATHSENNKHAYRTGLAKPVTWFWTGHYNSVDRSFPINQYDLKGNLIKEWPSAAEVKRQLGYNQTNIGYCVRGKYLQAYGFKWEYAKIS